jgi:hypothetical protein
VKREKAESLAKEIKNSLETDVIGELVRFGFDVEVVKIPRETGDDFLLDVIIWGGFTNAIITDLVNFISKDYDATVYGHRVEHRGDQFGISIGVSQKKDDEEDESNE